MGQGRGGSSYWLVQLGTLVVFRISTEGPPGACFEDGALSDIAASRPVGVSGNQEGPQRKEKVKEVPRSAHRSCPKEKEEVGRCSCRTPNTAPDSDVEDGVRGGERGPHE